MQPGFEFNAVAVVLVQQLGFVQYLYYLGFLYLPWIDWHTNFLTWSLSCSLSTCLFLYCSCSRCLLKKLHTTPLVGINLMF